MILSWLDSFPPTKLVHLKNKKVISSGLPVLQESDRPTDSQSVVEGNSDIHTKTPTATLCIERALHLTLPSAGAQAASDASVTAVARESNQGRVAVAFEWRGLAHTTPAVALSHAGSATWQYHVALPGAEASAGSGRELEPAHRLHLQVSSQVWYRKMIFSAHRCVDRRYSLN